MTSCRILQLSIFVVINLHNNGGNQVEALPKHLIVGDGFQGVERIKYLPFYVESRESEESSDITKILYDPKLQTSKRRTEKKNVKKSKPRRGDKKKLRKRSSTEKFEKKKRKPKNKIKNGKYVVTTVKESVDENMKSKPVDIIVHISMDE